MFKDLEQFAGERIFSGKAVQLKVTLKLEGQDVWRRIIVPADRTFEDLHGIIQVSFGWKDYHLHEYYLYDHTVSGSELSPFHPVYHEGGYSPVLNLVCSEEAYQYTKELKMVLETGIKLSEYIPPYKRLKYIYDFGDTWQHYIDVEKTIEDYDTFYPVCLEGEGNTPPEDVGGPPGYMEFREILLPTQIIRPQTYGRLGKNEWI
jgi:hypothetical protein